MKRYRVLAIDFDTRAFILTIKINEDSKPEAAALMKNNKRMIREGLLADFGIQHYERKLNDFIELGKIPFSFIAFHNNFLRQARDAFVIGGYYPCLTSLCALGERILNHLILRLRDYYRSTDQYKKVYRKDSFDNWDLAIDTLESWNILLPEAASSFRDLRDIRNRSLHFNPDTDHNDRELAIEAYSKLSECIVKQFGTENQPWYIEGTRGAWFIKKDYETVPFVKEIILPNCANVGHLHLLDQKHGRWIINDDHKYDDVEISDSEFKDLYNNRKI